MDTKSKGWLWGQKVLDTIHLFTTRSQISDGKFLSDKRTHAKCAVITGGKKRLWMEQIGHRIVAPHVFAVGSTQVLIKLYYLEHRGGSAAALLFHSMKVSFPPRWKCDWFCSSVCSDLISAYWDKMGPVWGEGKVCHCHIEILGMEIFHPSQVTYNCMFNGKYW